MCQRAMSTEFSRAVEMVWRSTLATRSGCCQVTATRRSISTITFTWFATGCLNPFGRLRRVDACDDGIRSNEGMDDNENAGADGSRNLLCGHGPPCEILY